MKLIILSAFIFLSVVTFLWSNIYLLENEDTLKHLVEDCNRESLNILCGIRGFHLQYIIELVRFLSAVTTIFLLVVLIYALWKALYELDWYKQKFHEKQEEIARKNRVLGAYKKKMNASKRNESKFVDKVDQYKLDIMNSEQQMKELEESLEKAHKEIEYFKTKSHRQWVRERTNWARMTKREGTMKRHLVQLEERLLAKERELEEFRNERRVLEERQEALIREGAILEEAAGMAQGVVQSGYRRHNRGDSDNCVIS